MSQKTREKYGIRLPVMVDVGRNTDLTAVARDEAAREVEASAPVWNNISRLWFVQTGAGMVPCDPQPAAPSLRIADAETPWASGFNGPRAIVLGTVPPSVKVSA